MSKPKIELTDYIRSIENWPKKGILFRDITPLLKNPDAFSQAVQRLASSFRDTKINYVAAVEARGFIFGVAIAAELGVGFIPIRKKGKLPFKTESITYDLEYGTDTLEVHLDALKPKDKVLMVDDLLATGGTMAAACELIEKIGGTIAGITFLIELSDLKGREKIKNYTCTSTIIY